MVRQSTRIKTPVSYAVSSSAESSVTDSPDISDSPNSLRQSSSTQSRKKQKVPTETEVSTATEVSTPTNVKERFITEEDINNADKLELKKKLQILDTYKDFGRRASRSVTKVLSEHKTPDKGSRIAVDIVETYLPELGYQTITLLRPVITVHELLGKLFDKNKKQTGKEEKHIVLERSGHNSLFKKYCKCCGDYKESRCKLKYCKKIEDKKLEDDLEEYVKGLEKESEKKKKKALDTNVRVNEICKFIKSKPKKIQVSSDSSSTVEEENSDEYCNLYKEFYSLANDYDEKQVPLTGYSTRKKTECRERIDGFRTYPDIDINTTKKDGLLAIDNVKLHMENTKCYKVNASKKKNQNNERLKYPVTCKYYESSIKYDIDEITEKNIELDDIITKIPGPDKIIKDIIEKLIKLDDKKKEVQEPIKTTTENINKIFNLNYKDYKDNEDEKKKYIKCLFDFKRLGDLQLIKVAEESKLPFVTGDRLAAIIANRSYGITSLYIDNNKAELYETQEDKYTIKEYTVIDTIRLLLQEISILEDNDAKEHIKKRIPEYYWKSLYKLLDKIKPTGTFDVPAEEEDEETGTDVEDDESETDEDQTGGNPQDLPEKMNEDRWYYAIGLFKIIKEYVPRDKGTVGDNTVLLFQYMFLGYMYDLHDEDVIDYVEKYLKSSSIEQSATDYKSPAKQVYTFQPDIPEKVESLHKIQQSVSKDTHTDVYNNNYNGIIDTATSRLIKVGGKQNTTKFMKNVIKDFKKLFV
jgi:hypothetical protein